MQDGLRRGRVESKVKLTDRSGVAMFSPCPANTNNPIQKCCEFRMSFQRDCDRRQRTEYYQCGFFRMLLGKFHKQLIAHDWRMQFDRGKLKSAEPAGAVKSCPV